MTMKLAQANAIVAGALALAEARGAKPLGVAVLDAGGNLVAFQRQDGASLFRFDIAKGKADGALGMGVDSAVLAERAKGNPMFFQSVVSATSGKLVLSGGGVLAFDGDALVGAVGVSGDTPDVDAACAVTGIAAAGLSSSEQVA